MSSVARQSVAGVAVAGNPIASANAPAAQQPYNFPPGSHTFTPPRDGYWKFVLWGAGPTANGSQAGSSGAYCEITKYLSTTQSVAIFVSIPAGSPVATTATFPDGSVASAGSADGGGTPGVATGGDVNLAGSALGVAGLGTGGGAASLGAGAPANAPFRGAPGGGSGERGKTPGSGGATTFPGGDGLALAVFVRS